MINKTYVMEADFLEADPEDENRVLASPSILSNKAIEELNEKFFKEAGIKMCRMKSGEVVLSIPNTDKKKSFSTDKDPMMRPISNERLNEFTDTGLVLLVNQILHAFGFCIGYHLDESTGVTRSLYVARTKFRGFSPESTSRAYQKLAKYMMENAAQLKEEADS